MQDCGRSDVPLEVHHVNGDPMDNRIRNTIPLRRAAPAPGQSGPPATDRNAHSMIVYRSANSCTTSAILEHRSVVAQDFDADVEALVHPHDRRVGPLAADVDPDSVHWLANEAPVRQVRQRLPGRAELIDRDPARRVRPLDDPRVVDVGVLGAGPLQEAQVRPTGVGDRAAALDGGLRLTVNEGLDGIVDDTFAGSITRIPASDNALVRRRSRR